MDAVFAISDSVTIVILGAGGQVSQATEATHAHYDRAREPKPASKGLPIYLLMSRPS
jgi:hypothetical protein